MTDITWIKLKTKMFDDEKIQLIEAMPEADAILIIWLKLLIQAGKANSNGDILLSNNIPYTPEMLATVFRRPLQILKFALKTLSDLDMIEVTERNVISITNWEKHQNIEGLDKIREQNRIRQRKYRDQKNLKTAQKQDNNNVTVTLRNGTDIDIEKEKEKELINTIVKKWNLFAEKNNLSKIRSVTKKRKSHLKARLKEDEFDLDEIFSKIQCSDFLLGGSKGGWTVNFDFIIRSQDNYVKILEGGYETKTKVASDPYLDKLDRI